MRIGRQHIEKTTYVDTPKGIFTAAGVWFRTTENEVEAFAGPVLQHMSLKRLLNYAEVWLRSPETLTLWLLPILLTVFSSLAAVLSALLFFVGWKYISPSISTLIALKVVHVFDSVYMQHPYYVVVLSILAWQQVYTAVWIGLAGFILIRWGLITKITEPLFNLLWKVMYVLPIPDQVLRSIILRVALKHHISLPQLDHMEEQITKIWSRG